MTRHNRGKGRDMKRIVILGAGESGAGKIQATT